MQKTIGMTEKDCAALLYQRVSTPEESRFLII